MINILDYLENSAEVFPDKIAVTDEKCSCTYDDLQKTCERVGSALIQKVKIGLPVAVMMEKGIDALYAFFGTVYAGGYYILMNPELPINRLNRIQSVLNAHVVITDSENLQLANDIFSEESVFLIDDLKKSRIDTEGLKNIRERMIDTDPLYANFTSGSTGVPKGVVVSHKSVIDFIDIFTDIFRIESNDIIGNQAPFDFDVSVKDIYSTIKTGATMVIVPKRLFSNPKGLMDYICDYKITTMIWAVSALCLISTFHGLDYRIPKEVNKVLFSGEIMPVKHLKTWMEHLPNAMFVNLYGPTEITCNCTYHIIDHARNYEEGIPIGKHFPNEQVFLLNEDDSEVTAVGEVGEICVRGTALALGYYGNKQQTDVAFTVNPLNKNCFERIYRTGDLGRYDEHRDLFFCGRKDFQIKYMGHRIELEEIELAISNIRGVERCCCVFDDQKQKLYGFYIGNIERKELHIKLKGLLPIYMVPGALRKVDDFPLTKNGKTDRKQLLEMK